MSTQTPVLPVIQACSGTRSRLIRRAKLLSWLSLAWMTIEGAVGVTVGFVAGSVALTREAWAGEVCADCIPVGFENNTCNAQGCDCD